MIFRVVIVFLLTILIIPRIHSQTDDTTEQIASTDTETTDITSSFDSSTDPIATNTTSVPEESIIATLSSTNAVGDDTTLIDSTTSEPLSSESSTETSEQTSTTLIISTISSSDTTEPSVIPFFYCDFTNSSCFENGQINITTGTEFNPSTLSNDTSPPRLPYSDVTSIDEPTNNGKKCVLPYQLSPEITSWNMSFCYKQQCPTGDGEEGMCETGNYGLIILDASETSKTISNSFHSSNFQRNSHVEQRLRFYYYFTVYENQLNWNQRIGIWVKPENEPGSQQSIGNLTIDDMNGNKWQSHQFTFQSSSDNYTLEFVFTADLRIDESNETIYFALDNIELYEDVIPDPTEMTTESDNFTTEFPVSTTTPFPISTTTTITTTTTTTAGGTRPPDAGSDLGMIIGLSLGIGIPVILIAIGGIILYKKKGRNASNYDIQLTGPRPRKESEIFYNPLLF